jgi:hypothetical protein
LAGYYRLWLPLPGHPIRTVKIFVETLDSGGVVPIIGRGFSTFSSREGEEKEVIMRSNKICYRVYDVSVRDIPEG